ncbi:MAG: hypothetical protein KAT46_01255 [Deltaproteobacteria bacterium]|nr:hypothetical protein [Deltaproteobacteria bacterium]
MNLLIFSKKIKYFSILIILLSLSACSSLGKETPPVSNIVEGTQPLVVKKVAVLPFFNVSGRVSAGSMVADIYVSELFNSGKFSVEEPGNIRQFYIQERVGMVGQLGLEDLQVLGKRLRVDGVITGTVEEFSEGIEFATTRSRTKRSSTPVVSISARMIESQTGRTVWASHNKKRGDDYTLIFDIGEVKMATSLASKVIKEMIETIDWQ